MVVDGIPTSCLASNSSSSNCTFNFTDTATPTIHSVSPATGQGGDSITIRGHGFGENTSAISVLIGSSAWCQVDSSTNDSIVCVTSRHAAGSYLVQVLVEGVGRALNMAAACYTYTLTLSSVTPEVGGVTGGYLIEITGEGFPDFDPVSPLACAGKFSKLLGAEFGAEFGESDSDAGFAGRFSDNVTTSATPWLRYGLGCPSEDLLEMLLLMPLHHHHTGTGPQPLCPEASSGLENQLRNATRCLQTLYSNDDDAGGGDGDGDGATSDANGDGAGYTTSEGDGANGDGDGEEGESCRSLCPLGDCQDLSLHLIDLFPSHVTVGGSPCVIVESTVDHMTCVPAFSLPLSGSTRSVDVMAQVFDQSATLADGFTVGAEYTPVVTSVSVVVGEGPVSGGTVLTLTVEGFATTTTTTTMMPSSSGDGVGSVDVRIGSFPCEVSSVNDTTIVCTTPPHSPGFQPIHVSTAAEGTALLQSSLSDLQDEVEVTAIDGLFPKFEYRLFAEMDGVPLGSLVGGTPVVIYPGGIFVEGETRVYFGELGAEIVALESDRLVVLTPSSAVTKEIYLIVIEMRGL